MRTLLSIENETRHPPTVFDFTSVSRDRGRCRGALPTLESEGDFFIADPKGIIRNVGHIDLDFPSLYRAYAAGKSFHGKARFSMGVYDGGKVSEVGTSGMSYSFDEQRAVFRLQTSTEGGHLDLVFQFDPSLDILTAEVEEGTSAGPHVVGSADIRFRKK